MTAPPPQAPQKSGKLKGTLSVTVSRAVNLAPADQYANGAQSSDPFAIVHVAKQSKKKNQAKNLFYATTHFVPCNLNPVWNANFLWQKAKNDGILVVEVFDHDPPEQNHGRPKQPDPLGCALVDLSCLAACVLQPVTLALALQGTNARGHIFLTLQFYPEQSVSSAPPPASMNWQIFLPNQGVYRLLARSLYTSQSQLKQAQNTGRPMPEQPPIVSNITPQIAQVLNQPVAMDPRKQAHPQAPVYGSTHGSYRQSYNTRGRGVGMGLGIGAASVLMGLGLAAIFN